MFVKKVRRRERLVIVLFFFFQAEDGIRDYKVTGVQTCALPILVLKYRVDPSTNLNLVSMVNNGAGLFSGIIPGQSSGGIVAFQIQASDNFSPGAATLFPNDAPKRECLIRWGDPVQG